MKGLKLRAAGAAQVEALKSMGVVPIASLSAVDIYEALSKGVIDGVLIDWTATGTYKLWESADYVTDLFFSSSPMHLVMNLNTWNKLPKDVQDQVMTVSGRAGSEFWGKSLFDVADQRGRDGYAKIMAADPKKQLIKLTKEQSTAFRTACGPPNDKYIADVEAKGLPAKSVYNAMLTLIDKYAAK